MKRLFDYLEPFHQLKPITDLGYWRRHQRDAILRSMAAVFVHYTLRWAVITVSLLILDEFVPPGAISLLCAVLSSIALSFALVIGTTAAAFVIGSKIRTA
jgi:hypothetical protein